MMAHPIDDGRRDGQPVREQALKEWDRRLVAQCRAALSERRQRWLYRSWLALGQQQTE
jgi:hypothetical protein